MSKEQALSMLQATIPVAQPTSSATAPVVATEPKAAEPTASQAPKPTQLAADPGLSHLAKKEAELQRNREAFKKEQADLAAERQKVLDMAKDVQTFRDLQGKDRIAALKHLGFSDQDLLNYIAAQEDTSTPEEKAARAAQAEIKKFQDENAKKEADAVSKRNADALAAFRADISATISKNPETYEYCNYHGPLAEELIYETVAAVLETEKELISVREAAEMVEQYYEDQDKGMNTLKKRQPKEAAAPAAPAKEVPLKPEVSPRPSSARTLSSKTGATVASTVTKTVGETPEQKKQRLISKYFGSAQ
jgi:hypothetical protein